MDRLIGLEPSNLVAIRVEPGQKCSGTLTLRNVMYTMPVAFRLQPMNKTRYVIRPQSGIISPLATLTVEIVYSLLPGAKLPDSFPYSDDAFLLHSVVVPGAAMKDQSVTSNSIPIEWFITKRKQVFIDSGIRIMFVGSPVLAQLVGDGSMDEIRDVLDKCDPAWGAADSIDAYGQSLLHLAISQSRPDLVQLLLEFEPNIEARSRSGRSTLEAASAAGESLIVELLLARRASTERSDSSKLGPLHLASGGGHLEVMRLLLLKGADVDAVTDEGCTALHLAVEERRRDCARLLLASGARPDIRNTDDGNTPLHISAGLGDEHMVKLLLQKGANKDIRNHLGKTAYDFAAEYGHTKLYDCLQLGDKLCTAARKGEVRTVQRLIENGALVNGRDLHGWTALHRAAFKGRIDVVRILLENGCDGNAQDEEGYTALHCATEAGQVEVTELLVKKGADVDARTNKGVTSLQIANSLQYTGIMRILMQGGASKEGFAVNSKKAPLFGVGGVGRQHSDNVLLKKKSVRARTLRNSLDHSMPLAVL